MLKMNVDDHFQNCFVPLDELLKERKKIEGKHRVS